MYSLHVRIVEAKELPKMDIIGSVDPYCQIQLNSMNQPKFTQKKRQNKTPVWNEEFHFPVRDIYAETLYIVLKDYDKVSADDPISQIQIPLKSLQISQVTDTWYQMVPFKGVKKGGKLRVVTHLGPSNEKPFSPSEKIDLSSGSNMQQQPNMIQQNYQQTHRPTMLPNQYPPQMMQQNQQKGRSNTMLPSDPQPYPYAMMMPSGMNQQNYQSTMMMQQQQNMMMQQPNMMMQQQPNMMMQQQPNMMMQQQPNMMMQQQPNLMMQQMNDQQFQSAPIMQPNGMQQVPAQQFASQQMMMQQMQPGMNQQNYQTNMMIPQQQMGQQQMQPGMMMQPNYQNNMMMQQQMQPSMMMMQQNYQSNAMMQQNVPK